MRTMAGIVVRVVILTVLVTMLSFAVGLFLGIVGVVAVNLVGGGHHDMSVAYRFVAFPLAIVGMACALVGMTGMEIRERRRVRQEWE